MNAQKRLNQNLRRAFEREIERLKSYFPNDPKQLEIAEEDGPMKWEDAMEQALIIPIELGVGGKMEMKINHDETDRLKFQGEKVFK